MIESDAASAEKGIRFGTLLTFACIFLTGIASAGLLAIKPLIVGALIDDYAFSPSEAGFVTGIEMAGIGIASFIAALLGGRWNRRLVIVTGATLGILGSIIPALTSSYEPILLTRLVAGFGCGLIAANVLAVIGTSRDPDRVFGFYYMTTYAGTALMVPGGMWAISQAGAAGSYILLAIILAAVYGLVLRIPGTPGGFRNVGGSQPLSSFPFLTGGLSLMVSLVFWMGVGAIWAFVERIGLEAGIDRLVIGGALSIGPFASVAGALTASILHTRFGRAPVLVVAIALAILGAGLIGFGGSAPTFTAGFLIFSYVWPLFLAYLGGAMAAVDPVGRVVAMSVASQTVGMAIGPAVGGIVATHAGYGAITVLGISCFAATFPVLGLLLYKSRAAAQA